MSSDSQVQLLVEEVLESGRSVEEVCRTCPELEREVRDVWRRCRAVAAGVEALFPEPGTTGDHETTPIEAGPLSIPAYEVLEELGRGGVGVVYKAVHLRLNRAVALKMLLAGVFATTGERRRFAREAEMVARLQHPNIVQVHDVGDCAGRPYFTMELVEGGSLAGMIAGTPRPARQAAGLVAALADALSVAHRVGIIHRDLKPANILLTGDGTPKIGDFGLAWHLECGHSLTQSGAVLGTPSYMAPEQARGKSGELGPTADLYALGAVLYELLTGRPPFRAESAAETLHQVLTQDPVPPSRLNAKVPRDLETICLKCLRKEPPLRYTDAVALSDDLRRFLHGETIAARPENSWERLSRRVRHRPVRSAALAAGILLSLVTFGLGLGLIVERADTRRSQEAERAAIERAADGDLREMTRYLQAAAWPEAAAAMERARGRLTASGSNDLRQRLAQGTRDLKLAARVDAVRLSSTRSVGGQVEFQRSCAAQLQILQEAGLGQVGDDPAVVAGRVRASSIRSTLIAVLDDCASRTRNRDRNRWLATVAQLADEDPTGWRSQVRDFRSWNDRLAFNQLVETAPVADQPIPFLISVANHLSDEDESLLKFLKRIQRAHPGDFWANILLGERLYIRGRPEESIRYLQAAVALRTDASIAYNLLGTSLSEAGHPEESVTVLEQCLRIDPAAAAGRHNLALALQTLGRHHEAILQSRIAISLLPEKAILHDYLGKSLEAVGKGAEGIDEYRTAVKLDPGWMLARQDLRQSLIRMYRPDQARVSWAEAIAVTPLDQNLRKGYAELCLFLGQDDEYRQACEWVLDQAERSAEPRDWEVAGRLRLLQASSDHDLRRGTALIDRALATQRRGAGYHVYFLAAKALAEYRAGRHEAALAIMEGDAAGILGPLPQLVVAMANFRLSRLAEARQALARATMSFDWCLGHVEIADHWMNHALRREAEALIVPDLLARMERGSAPQDQNERLILLGACQATDRPRTTARLYAEAFAADSRLADEFRGGHRYRAALAALRAGCGQGVDVADLGDPERAALRNQASQWLRDDLAAMGHSLNIHQGVDREAIRATLSRWRTEPILTPIRESDGMSSMTDDERNDWLKLWQEVALTIERAGGSG